MLGMAARSGEASTEANVAMQMSIPAIAIGGGGIGRGAHTLDETFDSTGSSRGTERALRLAIALQPSLIKSLGWSCVDLMARNVSRSIGPLARRGPAGANHPDPEDCVHRQDHHIARDRRAGQETPEPD